MNSMRLSGSSTIFASPINFFAAAFMVQAINIIIIIKRVMIFITRIVIKANIAKRIRTIFGVI